MWISADGRANTNAWGDPSAALGTAIRELLDGASLDYRRRVEAAVSLISDAIFDEIDAFAAATDPATEATFVREWMPPEILAHVQPVSVDDLIARLADLDLRWRLDARLVIEQYLDGD